MAGFITKQHFRDIASVYGLRVALRAMFSKQPTFLAFLQEQGLL